MCSGVTFVVMLWSLLSASAHTKMQGNKQTLSLYLHLTRACYLNQDQIMSAVIMQRRACCTGHNMTIAAWPAAALRPATRICT